MAGLRHNVPGEFKDETKWKIFSTKQLGFFAVACFITGLCFKISMALIGAAFPGILTGIIIGIFIMVPVMFKLPETEFLKGGGLYISTFLVRLWIRKRNQKIYVKGWGKE